MSYDFTAELLPSAASLTAYGTFVTKNRPARPLALALTFRDYPEMTTRAELVVVGAKAIVEVRILAQRFFAGRLRPGMVFSGSVGTDVVARGIVGHVENLSLALGEDVHPDSVNLHRYPADILSRIKSDFGSHAPLAFRELQELIGELPSVRSPRIIRAVLWLAGRDRELLDEALERARRDYRDILAAAEFRRNSDGSVVRVRDLSLRFQE